MGTKQPAASALLHVLVANVGDGNAIVASHKVLARLMAFPFSKVKRALKTLEDGNWIEVNQIGAGGMVNAYFLNGLPPVSQPSFPGMEQDLPASGREISSSFGHSEQGSS